VVSFSSFCHGDDIMSDNSHIKPRLPKCMQHPEAQVVRKVMSPNQHAFFCNEAPEFLGWACMSQNSGDLCVYVRHTTATHRDLSGRSWVDSNLDAPEIQTELE
jgi:hypothetical protein